MTDLLISAVWMMNIVPEIISWVADKRKRREKGELNA